MNTRTLLGSTTLSEAKRLRSLLADRGITLEIAASPEACDAGGCAPKVEVYVAETDRAAVQGFLDEEKQRSLAGLTFDWSLADEVFDPEKENARCPACGTSFSTRLTECPDCGLGFAGGPA